MKARLAWLAGGIGVGVAAAYRALRPRPASLPPAEEDPRAEELRHKLAEARAAVGERDEFEAAETPVDEVHETVAPAAERPVTGEPEGSPGPDEPGDLEERRRRVHERARANARRMRGRDPDAS